MTGSRRARKQDSEIRAAIRERFKQHPDLVHEWHEGKISDDQLLRALYEQETPYGLGPDEWNQRLEELRSGKFRLEEDGSIYPRTLRIAEQAGQPLKPNEVEILYRDPRPDQFFGEVKGRTPEETLRLVEQGTIRPKGLRVMHKDGTETRIDTEDMGPAQIMQELRRISRSPDPTVADDGNHRAASGPGAIKKGVEASQVAWKIEEGQFKGGQLQDPKKKEEGYWRSDQESLPKALLEIAEERFPKILQMFYPRVYEACGQYNSPKHIAAYLAMATVEATRLGFENSPTCYRLLLPALKPMIERKMPSFFIAPHLLEAILRTDFKEDINWVDMKLPFEQGFFILPRGAFIHPTDGEVAAIGWARFKKGVNYPPPIPGFATAKMDADIFILVGLTAETGIWFDSIMNATHRPTVRLNNLFYREKGERQPNLPKLHYVDMDLDEKDEGFLEKMGVIAFGTLLAMHARPDLIERGKLLRKVEKKDSVKEFWSPNVIGPRYSFKREVPKVSKFGEFIRPSQVLGGTHASPREHWRRGHWRNQPYGPKLKEHRTIWIEPMIVNRLMTAKGQRHDDGNNPGPPGPDPNTQSGA